MNQQFQWCFIGTGTLARQVAKAITESGRHRIVSVVSRRIEAAREFAQAWGAEAFEDPDEAMKAADAVYVVTPHPSHYAYVKRAIELGKPVLCEKPFTVKGDETEELLRMAEEKKVYVVEGMWTWFAPVARQVKAWVEDGTLGEVLSAVCDMRVGVIHYAPRLADPKLAGGVLLDSGVYPITYLYRLFGNPVEIRCVGRMGGGVDLGDEIDLTFQNGQTYHISLAMDEEKNPSNFLRIEGTRLDILLKNFHYTDHVDLLEKDGSLILRFEGKTTMLGEFDAVAEEIRAGLCESAFVPHRATLDVMRVMDECRRQIGLVYPFE